MWHMCDPMFSRFHTIAECDRHTRTDRQTDGQIHDDGMHSVVQYKSTIGLSHCIPRVGLITRQRALVDSKSLGTPRNVEKCSHST